MKYACLLLLLVLPFSTFATSEVTQPKISKFEFQGIHFGDFPSVDMICVRGLCPVGNVGVGINSNSYVTPAYNQMTAITHYHGVKISTPEYSYFDDKMFMLKFDIECSLQSEEECVEAVTGGLDADYGLIPIMPTRTDVNTISTEFITDTGSLISIFQNKEVGGKRQPSVRIMDQTLLNRLRKSINPDFVPPLIETVDAQNSVQGQTGN